MTAAGKTTVTRLEAGTKFLITDTAGGRAASATPAADGRWYIAQNKTRMVIATFVRHNGFSGGYDLVVTLPDGKAATVAGVVGNQTVWLVPEPAQDQNDPHDVTDAPTDQAAPSAGQLRADGGVMEYVSHLRSGAQFVSER